MNEGRRSHSAVTSYPHGARGGACVCTTLRGEVHALRSFIEYHLAIGFEHIYLFFDSKDDPGIPLAREYPRVTVTPVDDELLHRQFADTELPHLVSLAKMEVMARQELNVEMAIRRARDGGFAWLLHIDIDELFWPANQNVREYFEGLSATNVGWCTFLNLEAVPERLARWR